MHPGGDFGGEHVSEAGVAQEGPPAATAGRPAEAADVEALIRRIWASRCRWSEAANASRDRVRRWRMAQLALAVAGSVLAALAASWLSGADVAAGGAVETADGAIGQGAGRAAALLGAVALAMVGFIQFHFLKGERVAAWARLRSASEGLKSEVFRFRARARPYEADPNGTLLAQRTAELESSAGDLAHLLPAAAAKPSEPPGPLTPATYLEARVDQQISRYYAPQARKNQGRADLYRNLAITAAGVGTVLSIAMAVLGIATLGIWVPVLTTLAAAFAAHSAVERYEFNAKSYAQHAQRLEALARSWQADPLRFDPAVWSDFVHDVEETISVENRGWMADMLREVEGVADVVAKARAEARP